MGCSEYESMMGAKVYPGIELMSRFRSTGHAVELRNIERLGPLQTTLREHLQLRRDQFGVIEAPQRDEDGAREALQVAREQPRAAPWAEVAIESPAGLGDIVMALRSAADEAEVILRHGEERRHFTARGSLAIQAVTARDEFGVFVELEPHCAAGTLRRVLLGHRTASRLSRRFRVFFVDRCMR